MIMGETQGYLKWKESMEYFIYLAEKIAKPIVQSLRPSSQPASVTGEDVERLRLRLHRIRAALEDANRVKSKSASFRLWQFELREVVCEAEDILSEFELQAQRSERLLQLKSELLQRSRTVERKRKMLGLLSRQPFHDLGLKIKRIRERYNDMAFDRNALCMRDEDGEKRQPFFQDRQSSSLISTNSCLSGRDKELEDLIDRVVSVKDGVPVIAIVGMPGVGKTALAQHVFNSSQVKDLFAERRWWVAMSCAGCDATSATRSIIDAVTAGQAWEARSCHQLDALQQALIKELKKRGENGFLLVLDDARAESQGFWDTLCRPFSYLSGGKLLVTTQSPEIAQYQLPSNCEDARNSRPLYLLPLADEDCLSIVCTQQEANCMHLESMRKMIPWCGGLPLAANILKNLIFRKPLFGAEDCEHPLPSSEAIRNELVKKILPILGSNYDDLSLCSKRCFEYLSLFPRGHALDREQLTRLWTAQELEKSDNSCFEDLVRKWMLVNDSDARKHRVHRLFHELARNISNGECAMVEECIPANACSVLRKTRHLSLVLQVDAEGSLKQEVQFTCADGRMDELARLRTLLLIRRQEDHKLPFSHARFSAKNFQFFPYLRTLDLSHSNIEELPFAIGNLSHLRYLGLRNTRIQDLPESLCLLYKLQTLDLQDCHQLKELPWGIGYLSDLQHLELPPSPHLLMPRGIGRLTRLRTLSTFVAGNSDALCHIGELKDLVNLRGQLYISGLNHVSCEKEAEEANLKGKKLEKLTLKWSLDDSGSSGDVAETATKVLEKLQPCPTLKSLMISGFYGTKLSSWLGDESFTQLVSVTLEGCAVCTQLPSLGQLPVLKHLTVALMKRLQHVGREFCGSSHGFPLLETLEFHDMPLWEVWCGVGREDFASLKVVSFTECPELNKLPEFKPTTKLLIMDARHWPASPSVELFNCD